MEKVFVVTQESCVDGKHLFNVSVCATLEGARKVMKKEIDTILDESPKYKGAREEIENGSDEYFDWDLNDDNFHIHCLYDAYYEYIEITETNILKLEDRFDCDVTLSEEFAMNNAHNIMQGVGDDWDWETILSFVRYKE